MKHLPASTAAFTIIAAFVLTTANAQISQPGDLIRTEGEKQVFIPCPFDSSSAPFWRINSTYFHHTRLPCPFIASNSPAGLVITVVDHSISGTTFQCLASVNGVLQESSTGELTVNRNPLSMSNGGGDDPALEIELVYQQLRFTSQQLNLSWSIFDKDAIINDNDESSTTSTVFASTCDLDNATAVVNTTDTTTVFSTDGYQDAFFNITAFNETGIKIATVDEPFRIESNIVTKTIPEVFVGRTCPACVTVPQPENAPFFNIPRSASSNRHDSICKTVRAPSETGRCLDFTSSCDGFADSPFNSSLSVCSNTSSSNDYRMCFRNVTRGMNGTRVHFFYSARQPCSVTGSRVTSWEYIDSYELIVQDASVSVDVSNNITTGELCITSLPGGCYTTTVYNTTIYDVTGYYVDTATGIQDGVCTQLDALSDPSPECLPYLVEVDASNPLVTYSETITHRVGEAQATTSFCECAKSRLKAPITLNETADNRIQFSCSTEADLKIGFVIIAVDGDNQPTNLSGELLTCSATLNTVDLSNLVTCNEQFTVSARFTFPNGTSTTCVLSDSAITVYRECPTTEAPTVGPTVSPLVALVIPIVLVIVVIITIILLTIYLIRKCNSGSYKPQKAETRQMDRLNNQRSLDRVDEHSTESNRDAHAVEEDIEKIDHDNLDYRITSD